MADRGLRTEPEWDSAIMVGQHFKTCSESISLVAGTKATCWTKRNVESTFIHSFLLIISFLTILTNLIELFFNIFSQARKPAIRLQKAVSKNVQVLFKADAKNNERQFQAKTTHDMIQNELRHSNYNLNRAEFYE